MVTGWSRSWTSPAREEGCGTATVGVKQKRRLQGRVSNAINIAYRSLRHLLGTRWSAPRPLPATRGWAIDLDRRAWPAPEEIVFATGVEPLPARVPADLHAEGRLPGWVTGDGVYAATRLRAWLESDQVDTGYVLDRRRPASHQLCHCLGRQVLKTLIASDWVIDFLRS